MIKKIAVASLTVALLATSAIAAKGGKGGGGSTGTTTTTMTQEQKDTLLFIYQEEKVARDSYITLGNLFPNENTFQNIQGSEQKHMDSAQGLCEKYGVDISNIDETNVGEYIEITDIDDLEHAEIGMPADVVKVYESLKAGSYNHLDAFRAAIEAYK